MAGHHLLSLKSGRVKWDVCFLLFPTFDEGIDILLHLLQTLAVLGGFAADEIAESGFCLRTPLGKLVEQRCLVEIDIAGFAQTCHADHLQHERLVNVGQAVRRRPKHSKDFLFVGRNGDEVVAEEME